MTLYQAFGLVLDVPFDCPALMPAETGAQIDVVVEEGVVPRQLDGPASRTPQFDLQPGRFLARGGIRSGRFLITGGCRVVVQRNARVDEFALATTLSSLVLPAVLRQRGLLLLHAAAAARNGVAVALAGDSGHGKSTTVQALAANGWAVMSDDLTALRPDGAGGVEVLPGTAEINLTSHAIAGLGVDASGLRPQPSRRMKIAISAQAAMAATPAPLGRLFVLDVGAAAASVVARRLYGASKFAAVERCLVGPMMADDNMRIFSALESLVQSVEVIRLTRPATGWSIADVVDVVNGALIS